MFFSKRKATERPKKISTEEVNLQNKLQDQENQIKNILAAEENFKITGDLLSLISFWENIWESGGLLFNGSKWTFRLPDLYIMSKEYSKAKDILLKINNPTYKEKRDSYLIKIQKFL